MKQASYIVKVRSFTVPCRIRPGYGRNGWRDSTKWSEWKTVQAFESAKDAWEFSRSSRFSVGLQRAGVFLRGRWLRDQELHQLTLAETEAARPGAPAP